ncbi:MAG: lysine exporter LysO family protein [Clostridiales bacterium]|nr:lysine exporter LysO family protein [Clostridiales bacterium]
MLDLLIYLAVTVAGYFIGARLKKQNKSWKWVGKLQTLVIVVLVFLMGSRIGASEEIVASLGTIGLISFVFTIIIMIITVAAFTLVRRVMGFDRYGKRGAAKAAAYAKAADAVGAKGEGSTEGMEGKENADGEAAKPRLNSLTIIMVVFVAVGIAAGYLILPDGFIAVTGTLLMITLCTLLVLVGIDIGTEGTLAANFKSAGWRVVVFPFVSIGAMLLGCVIASLFLPFSVQDSACIGSGLGWYSLASAMLVDYSAKISAISFMHNVIREVVGILFIPTCAKHLGYIECYCLPGASSMDVCLPLVEKATDSTIAVYSFVNGVVLSAAVPVLVSIFMSL